MMLCFRPITEDNFDAIIDMTPPENHAAAHIYRKLGFVPTGVVEHGKEEYRLVL